MSEWKHLLTEWLNEYKCLQENEIKSFAAEHEHNHEIATAIFNLFSIEDENDGQSRPNDIETEIEQVCLLITRVSHMAAIFILFI